MFKREQSDILINFYFQSDISYLLQSNMYSPVYDQYWDSAM